MADEEFNDPRLAGVYDVLDGDRRDLSAYLAIAERLGARRVLDVGCGTGTLPLLLAAHGLEVVGVDPAAASLQVARAKAGAGRVTWILGSVDAFHGTDRDLVLMTGNTAQQITEDHRWHDLLAGARRALVPGGHLVFETRDPDARAWEGWTRASTHREVDAGEVGTVETWAEVVAVDLPLVRFRWTWTFEADGATLVSDSTIRFPSTEEVRADLAAAGFSAVDLRAAPDRPGEELVFIARRAAAA